MCIRDRRERAEREAHLLRVARNDHHIADEHLADAIELLVERNQPTLSTDRTAKDPFQENG